VKTFDFRGAKVRPSHPHALTCNLIVYLNDTMMIDNTLTCCLVLYLSASIADHSHPVCTVCTGDNRYGMMVTVVWMIQILIVTHKPSWEIVAVAVAVAVKATTSTTTTATTTSVVVVAAVREVSIALA
jgi:hypothetical protein